MDAVKETGLRDALKYAVELALATTTPKVVGRAKDGSVPVMVVPQDCTVMGLDHLQPQRPDRIRATVQMVDVKSFVRYVNEHKGPTSRVFASVLKAPFFLNCLLDYHGGADLTDRPSFVTHSCRLEFTPTDAYREWAGKNNVSMPQDEFALFIEERQPDVMEPKGADMLELARSIEATREVSFKRKIRLDNGDTMFAFDERTDATAGMNGQLRIPEKMVLKFPLFLGMPDQCVDCRFRYRMDAGRLLLSYEIVRPQELVLKTLQAALDIVVDETGLPSFMGVHQQ